MTVSLMGRLVADPGNIRPGHMRRGSNGRLSASVPSLPAPAVEKAVSPPETFDLLSLDEVKSFGALTQLCVNIW